MMNEAEKRNVIAKLYDTLVKKDVNAFASYFINDAALSWGIYRFNGVKEITRWAEEFSQLFKETTFYEKNFEVQSNKVINSFVINVVFPEGNIGILHCKGVYEFKDAKIRKLKITLSRGYVPATKTLLRTINPDNLRR
ncbi:MAG: hypothetical protein JSV20_00325 [Candidatus Bathyarchaeota archaeon]|nr:MAG: hypothetical protein JSV20_00325 [Candidatus Bathyarchaeota archaeon]